jgi:CRISPR-associated protein Cmr3
MANFQFKLTPVDSFFFGGEKHIKDKNGDLQTNYFVESLAYPQQTTLLGMLRYYLLLKNNFPMNGAKITNQIEAEKLIGAKSFDFNLVPENMGVIETLSPLYFCNDKGEYFQFAPLDLDFEMDKDFRLFKPLKNGSSNYYNSKEHYFKITQSLVSAKGHKFFLKELIESVQQTGNEKSEEGENKDNKFYKQVSKRMNPGWSFCFDAEIGDLAGLKSGDKLFVQLGGEKSYFKLEVTATKRYDFQLPAKYRTNQNYVYCLSDCFVDSAVLDLSNAAVNKFVSFRNFQSNVKNTSNYSGFSRTDPQQPYRSSRFNLLLRGSVMYFNTVENLTKALELIQHRNDSGTEKLRYDHCMNTGFNIVLTHTK